MTGELSRMKKSRAANRNVLNNLVVKAEEIGRNGLDEEKRKHISDVLKAIEAKRRLINELDAKILDTIEEEKIGEEVEDATAFELKTISSISAIERLLMIKKEPVEAAETTVNVRPSMTKSGVKLPKIDPKKFHGDPTKWQHFYDTFHAAVHSNPDLNNIEKFTYLAGYLKGAAEKCIEGLPLTEANYEVALNLLKERFANPQRIAAAHMTKLLKIEKVSASRNVRELRDLYDHVESQMRALQSSGTLPDHYGPLLIPIISERLPDDIKLEISRKLGTSTWKIDDFMQLWKNEITARESCNLDPSRSKSEEDSRPFTTEALFSGARSLVCSFCGQSHYHDKCTVVTDLSERKEIVRKKRLCFKCLFSGHNARKCNKRRSCFKCKSAFHHTAICTKSSVNPAATEEIVEMGSNENSVTSLVSSRTSVLLQTAEAVMSDTSERISQPVKILLDSGSQRTYVTQKMVKKLNLQPVGSKQMTVKTFGDPDGKPGLYSEYRFCIKNTKRGINLYMTGYAVPHICSPLSGQKVDNVEKLFPTLKGLEISDSRQGDEDINLLIGADYYWSVVEGRVKRCESDGLIAMNTKLGWVLSGPYERGNNTSTSLMVTHSMVASGMEVEISSEDLLSKAVEKLWDYETLGIREGEEEESMYEMFVKRVKVAEDGRYEAPLPFIEDKPFIEDHYAISEKRLLNLKKKLDKDIELRGQYDQIIKEQLQVGILEEATTDPLVGEVTYLPHRAVIRDDKATTKVRVVCDCSAKNRNGGRSLNDCLWKGPNLTQLLFDVSLRLRVGNIVLTADAEKAYLNISVAPGDRDYLRIIWFDDVCKEDPKIVKLRFARVLFGARPSQFILNVVFKLHAEKYMEIDPEFVTKILRCFYSDDLNATVRTYEEGIEFYKKAKLRFLEGKFNLRKWRTNDERLRKFIEEEEVASDDVMGCIGDKVLGVKWDEIKDEFVIDLSAIVEEASNLLPTKRNVLKIIASIYDPLGLVQPTVVSLKILFQLVWISGIGWDDVIDDELKTRWYAIIEGIKSMGKLYVARCYCYNDVNDPIINVELHGFSDASQIVYACCIYFKFVKKSGCTKVCLVSAKSRIVSVSKKQTIPRLELMANLWLP